MCCTEDRLQATVAMLQCLNGLAQHLSVLTSQDLESVCVIQEN